MKISRVLAAILPLASLLESNKAFGDFTQEQVTALNTQMTAAKAACQDAIKNKKNLTGAKGVFKLTRGDTQAQRCTESAQALFNEAERFWSIARTTSNIDSIKQFEKLLHTYEQCFIQAHSSNAEDREIDPDTGLPRKACTNGKIKSRYTDADLEKFILPEVWHEALYGQENLRVRLFKARQACDTALVARKEVKSLSETPEQRLDEKQQDRFCYHKAESSAQKGDDMAKEFQMSMRAAHKLSSGEQTDKEIIINFEKNKGASRQVRDPIMFYNHAMHYYKRCFVQAYSSHSRAAIGGVNVYDCREMSKMPSSANLSVFDLSGFWKTVDPRNFADNTLAGKICSESIQINKNAIDIIKEDPVEESCIRQAKEEMRNGKYPACALKANSCTDGGTSKVRQDIARDEITGEPAAKQRKLNHNGITVH